MGQVFSMIWKWIAPPADASESDLAVWRSGLSVFVFVDFVALVIVCLYLSGVIGPGFAGRVDLQVIHETIMERELMDLRRKQCESIRDENSTALEFATRSIQRRQREYTRFSNYAFTLPNCLEVGVRIHDVRD